MRCIAIALALLVTLSLPVLADEKAPEKPDMAKMMQTLKDAMTKLSGVLCGEWTGKDTFSPSEFMPKGGTFDSHCKATPTMGGLFIKESYTCKTEQPYTAFAIWSYDLHEKAYVMHWYDSHGHVSRYSGNFNENVLTLTGKHAGETSTLVWTIKDKNTITFEYWTTKGAEKSLFLKSECTRKAGCADCAKGVKCEKCAGGKCADCAKGGAMCEKCAAAKKGSN